MKIYLDLVPLKAFRRRKLREAGRLFLSLSGVSITTAGGEMTVEPVYTCLAAVERRGDLVFIDFAWGRGRLLAVLSPYRPFLHLERLDGFSPEEE